MYKTSLSIPKAHVDPETDRKLQPEVHRIQQETGVYAVPAVQEVNTEICSVSL